MNKEEFFAFIEKAEQRDNLLCKSRGLWSGNSFTGVENGNLYFEGIEYWSHGGREEHYSLLTWEEATMSEEKFRDYVIQEIEKTQNKKEKARQDMEAHARLVEQQREEAELKKYQELKAKYEQS